MSMVMSFPARLAQLASSRPGDSAIVCVAANGQEEVLTWRDFDERVQIAAKLLLDKGAEPGETLVVGFPNCMEHLIATWAGWAIGCLVLPLNHRMVLREREELLALTRPVAILADWADEEVITRQMLSDAQPSSTERLPDTIAHPGKAVASGGSTGTPKIIVDPRPWAYMPDNVLGETGRYVGFQDAHSSLVPGPLFHNMPFSWANLALFAGQTTILMERFEPSLMLAMIERHRVEFMTLVPTMMQRVARIPQAKLADLSSLRGVVHSGAPCPRWVKEAWLDIVPPSVVVEAFGSTEGLGGTLVRGDEWLEHRDTVGRPFHCEIQILDDEQEPVADGIVGEIYIRSAAVEPTYEYLGAAHAKSTPDGFISVGDMGWFDDEGYLYIADRRVDLIVSGGANVYPAEVEEVLSAHPGVADVVVVGIADDEWGRRVHALVQAATADVPPSNDELTAWCKERLSPYKVPKSYEFVAHVPRDEAGKIRRASIVEQLEIAMEQGGRR